jgi:N-methylhydantoinase A
MARALRVISVERGYDPADYALLCFGGAGGLHACDLAELLGMKKIIIPARAGVLSAMGMLVSEPGRELSMVVLAPLKSLTDEHLSERFRELETKASRELIDEGCDARDLIFQHQLELRYHGQSASIRIEWQAGNEHESIFHFAHEKASGLRLPHPVELVNVRLSAHAAAVLPSLDISEEKTPSGKDQTAAMPGFAKPVTIQERYSLLAKVSLHGPLLLTEAASTTWVKPGWVVTPDDWGNLLLEPG